KESCQCARANDEDVHSLGECRCEKERHLHDLLSKSHASAGERRRSNLFRTRDCFVRLKPSSQRHTKTTQSLSTNLPTLYHPSQLYVPGQGSVWSLRLQCNRRTPSASLCGGLNTSSRTLA